MRVRVPDGFGVAGVVATPISLPGRASRFRACDVGALAISPRPGRIDVKVVSG